jgi:hypothetical protein
MNLLNSSLSRIALAVGSLPVLLGSSLYAQSTIGGALSARGPGLQIINDFPNPSTNGSPLNGTLTGADGAIVSFSASSGSQLTPPPALLTPALGAIWSATNSPELFAGVGSAPQFSFFQASAGINFTFQVSSTFSGPINVTLSGVNVAFVSQVGNNFNSTVPGLVSPTATVSGFVGVSTVPTPSNTFPNNVDLVYQRFAAPLGVDFNATDNSAALQPEDAISTIDDTFSVSAGDTYYVTLQASVGSLPSGSGTAFDYLDPLLSLDPTFIENNPGASIIVSPGFSNLPATTTVTSSVPEMGNSALLLVLGFVALVGFRQGKAWLPRTDVREFAGA